MDLDLFRQFALKAGQGIGIVSPDGKILFMNPSFLEMLKIPSLEEACNMKVNDLYFPEDIVKMEANMGRALDNEGSWKTRINFKRTDGTAVFLEQDIFPMIVNETRYLCFHVTDISNLKMKENDLRNEKEFYMSFTESLGDWVWEMDQGGTHTYSNEAVKDILGYTSEETIGKDATDFWLERTLTDEQLERHKKSLQSGKGWTNVQAVFGHKDGHPVYVLSSAVPIFNNDGDLKGYRGIDRDITDRVMGTIKLNESREKLDSIIENAREIIFTSDVKGCIDFISRAVKTSLGYEPEEIVGNTIIELVHPEDRELLWNAGIEIVRTGEASKDIDYRLKNKDGGYVWHRVTMSPKVDGSGSVQKIVGVTQDITQRKDNENRILQYNELLHLINKILRHDLTNNLFMIRTALDHYKDVRDDQWLGAIEIKAQRSFELIEQMRSLESLVASGGGLRPVDVQEALVRIKRGFDIPIEINCDLKVKADDAFYSVMENLIRNAVVHGNTDRMEFTSSIQENGMVKIDVVDHGKGIPDEIKGHIFEETFRYGKSAGTGLGLYIVYRTLDRYGGSISVSDTEGGGATFSIILDRS